MLVGNKWLKIVLPVIVIVIIAGVAFWYTTYSNIASSSTNGKIEIPMDGVQIHEMWVNVTVDNTGSVPVWISYIYVNGGAYGPAAEPAGNMGQFWPDTCFGEPCSKTNGILNNQAGEYYFNNSVYVIQPGQSITFTVGLGAPLQKGTITVKVVGSNQAEATAETTY